MSSIKGPAGPGSVRGPQPLDSIDPAATSERPDGASFRDLVKGAEAAGEAQSPGAKGVVEALRAGRITPDAAVEQLTRIAIDGSASSPEMRAAVESRVREMLDRDPLVRDLLRQMGASLPKDE